MYSVYENIEYEVLTNDGFKDFFGIQEISNKDVITLEFRNTSITCTEDHGIYTTNGKMEAGNLTIGDECISNGENQVVTNIIKNKRQETVYDLLNVADGNKFYANEILVSNCVFLDEYAFISGTVAPEFMKSVFPTISAGKHTKLIIVSTPRGMNHYYRLWTDAIQNRNGFVPIEVHWSEHPDRDEEWAKTQRAVLGEEGWAQEYECEFMGSSDTLISSAALRSLVPRAPIMESGGFAAWEEAKPGHRYVVTADVAEGIGQDHSAASVIDVTEKPYRQVARYYDNRVSVLDYPSILYSIATRYNTAFVLIEIGGGSLGVGDQVASTLRYDFEYENLFVTTETTINGFRRQAQELTFGMGPGKKTGIKTTAAIKRRGCVNVKDLIEQHNLVIEDAATIWELTNFVKNGESFEATEGEHDDLAMTLVLFGWLAKQTNFESITSTSIQRKFADTGTELPFPIRTSDETDDAESAMFVSGGDVWTATQWTGGGFG
jgi:hypothetical protein